MIFSLSLPGRFRFMSTAIAASLGMSAENIDNFTATTGDMAAGAASDAASARGPFFPPEIRDENALLSRICAQGCW
jgi:hypothetical protein